MWKCPECGEEIEDQFDECWQCASHKNKALLELLNGDWENLWRTSKQWLDKDANDPEPKVFLYLASLFMTPPKISEYLQLTTDLEENTVEMELLLSWLKQFEGQAEYSNNPYYQGLIASLYEFNDKDKTIDILEKAIEKNPTCPELYVWLGRSSSKTEAVNYFKKAIEFRPIHPAALFFLASSYTGLKQYKEAEECIKKAISLQPNFKDAHLHLGSLFHSQGLINQSRNQFQKVIEIDPEGDMGRMAKKFLEGEAQPSFKELTSPRKTLPSWLIYCISILSGLFFGGFIMTSMGSKNIYIYYFLVFIATYCILSAIYGRKKS